MMITGIQSTRRAPWFWVVRSLVLVGTSAACGSVAPASNNPNESPDAAGGAGNPSSGPKDAGPTDNTSDRAMMPASSLDADSGPGATFDAPFDSKAGLIADAKPDATRAHRRADLAGAWNNGGLASVAVYPSTGTALGGGTQWIDKVGGWIDDAKWASGDFDGDGLTDLVAVWNDGGMNSMAVRRSTGSMFTVAAWGAQQGGWQPSTVWLAGDFNGDGRADLAGAWNNGGQTSVAVFLSTGSAFGGGAQWIDKVGGWVDGAKWVVGDFDGDGRSDVAAIWNDGGLNTISVRRSTGSAMTLANWATQQGGWVDSTVWLAGDFNGDGRTDIAGAWNNGGQTSVAIATSNGSALVGLAQWIDKAGGWIESDGARWVAGDFDGDGFDDLAAVWNDNQLNTVAMRRSTGSALTLSTWAVQQGGWEASTVWLAGTFR